MANYNAWRMSKIQYKHDGTFRTICNTTAFIILKRARERSRMIPTAFRQLIEQKLFSDISD